MCLSAIGRKAYLIQPNQPNQCNVATTIKTRFRPERATYTILLSKCTLSHIFLYDLNESHLQWR